MMSGELQQTELLLLLLATIGYVAAWALYLGVFLTGGEKLGSWAKVLIWAAWLLHAASFSVRTYRAGHLPIYNAYEFSSAFAGGIVLAHLIFERLSRRRDLALFIIPVALGLLFHAWMLAKAVEPIIPIFRSFWLKTHILTAFVAYSSFAATFAASCLYIVRSKSPAPLPTEEKRTINPRTLDNVAYRAATVGFCFLSVCIISGAIWAEYVWGRFWSWDPKETWSLITWLIFAAYLHTRYHRGWRERRAAILGVVGFTLVLITYLGVDIVSPGQHDFLLWRRQ
ncbi:MAG: c-type cytochrome biogenesis protein CcsB [candidate division NC10 bacterium]